VVADSENRKNVRTLQEGRPNKRRASLAGFDERHRMIKARHTLRQHHSPRGRRTSTIYQKHLRLNIKQGKKESFELPSSLVLTGLSTGNSF